MRTFEEVGFAPATLGGLAGHLKTEKGLFFVFSIKEDVSEVEFNYSKSGEEDDLVNSYEIDIMHGDGFYEELKRHIGEVVLELGLNQRAAILYEEWRKGL